MSSRRTINAADFRPETPVPSRYDEVLFDRPRSVRIELARWEVRITVMDEIGTGHTYIADASVDAGDSIWLGTPAERKELLR